MAARPHHGPGHRRPDHAATSSSRTTRSSRSRPSIDADAEVVDAPGSIVIPGFVDTHRHTWEAAIRGCAPERHAGRLLRRGPRHVRAGVPARGRLRQQPRRLAGVPQRRHHHAGRLVAHQQHARAPGRRDPGRCRRPGSGRSTPTAAPTPRWPTTGSTAQIAIPGDDVRRIRDDVLLLRRRPAHDGRSPPAGPGFCPGRGGAGRVGAGPRAGHPDHRARRRWAGSPAGSGWSSSSTDLGLLGPDTTYIHCCYFSDEEWQLVADTGGTISIAPQVEVQMGHGWPPVTKALQVRAAAEPVDRRRDDGAGRHVHPDPRGVRRRPGPGQRGLLGAQRARSPRTC